MKLSPAIGRMTSSYLKMKLLICENSYCRFLYYIGLELHLRNWFFDKGILKTTKVSVPVISVGNISTGGVGKTPIIEMLIERMRNNPQLSVVSRGYGRKSSGTVIVSDGRSKFASIEDSGDEPSQISESIQI